MSFWKKIKELFAQPTLKVQFEQLLEKEEVNLLRGILTLTQNPKKHHKY